MTQQKPTFDISEFELRSYTNPFLTPEQKTQVTQTEARVNSQLDFLAQMLGWSGPNYWTNLPATVSQKRQILGGTFGVYNGFVIPRVYEIRNWNETIVVDKLDFIKPGQRLYIENVEVGFDIYTIRTISEENDKYVVSLGPLPESFYTQVANNVPIRVDIPTSRPAPFYRPTVGISGDSTFTCVDNNGVLELYQSYDTDYKFPYKFPILFIGSFYYFDRPIYLSVESNLTPLISPEYDSTRNLWYFQVPTSLQGAVGLTPYLVWANSNSVVANNTATQASVVNWTDPSDWGSLNVLRNFTGAWGNKGGELPFNLVFDSLSIHGFNENSSIYLPTFETQLNFNDIVNYIYYQKTVISQLAPGGATLGDLWWDSNTGALSTWLPSDSGCGSWVEIDYRESPRQQPAPEVVYPDVAAFRLGSGALTPGVVVRIDDISGLAITDNVIGVQGTLTSPAVLVLHRPDSSPYWVPNEFYYNTAPDFEVDALKLPYSIPVNIKDAAGLNPTTTNYTVKNLPITISANYSTLVIKYYENHTWEIYPDSILKYIADSALLGSPLQGEMWWDFDNTDPLTRSAAIYYQSAWVAVNEQTPSGPPAPVLDMGVILFYCNGTLLTEGIAYATEDFSVVYNPNPTTGKYEFVYTPFTLAGKAQTPTITISDSLTTTYRADVSGLFFSGISYYMSPNVYNAESPLRLWKAQSLQVADTLNHLAEDNYINPLIADLNNGPGPENWEKYFVRLPLEYERNGAVWQKVALICQNFAYCGSSIEPEKMRCPPEDDLPVIYEELFLYDGPISDYTYVYTEPYFYSNIGFFSNVESGAYQNAGVFPTSDDLLDGFNEADLVDYDPLHTRQANVTSAVGKGYGEWVGEYLNVNPCLPLTGFVSTDLISGAVDPVAAPIWDASIFKCPPTCENEAASYNVDANHYKIGYAYFVADASAAEDAFFDISQEAAWRYPVSQPKTLYLAPR